MYKFPQESTLITVTHEPVHLVKGETALFTREELTRYIQLIRRQRYTFKGRTMERLDPAQYTTAKLRELAGQLNVDLKRAATKKADAIHVLMNRIREIREYADDDNDELLLGVRD